jgi:hypothetical protein
MINKEETTENSDIENDEAFIRRYQDNEYEKQGRMSGKVTRTWVR